MTKPIFHQMIDIGAPASVVFKFIEDPNKVWALYPSEVSISDEQITNTGIGSTYVAHSRFLGLTMATTMTREDQIVDSRIVERSGVGGLWIWTIEPEHGYTRVTLDVEFHTPVPFLDKALSVTVFHGTDKEIALWLAAIREELEG